MFTRYVIFHPSSDVSLIFFLVIQISNWSLSWLLVQAGPGNIKHFDESTFSASNKEKRNKVARTCARARFHLLGQKLYFTWRTIVKKFFGKSLCGLRFQDLGRNVLCMTE